MRVGAPLFCALLAAWATLSDRVVIMSAGPAARIIGDWRVELPRPRDIAEIKLDDEFHRLYREIWHTMKDEVMKGYVQAGGGA
jgi:NitT/TauT family transport system ATP-binding protein